MQEKQKKITIALLLTMAGLYVLDQVTKLYVVFNFDPPSLSVNASGTAFGFTIDTVPVIENYFNIVRVHNTGVAFGLGNGEAWSSYVFMAIPILAFIGIVILWRRGYFNTLLMRWGAGFLLAGICGNLTDRLLQGFLIEGLSTIPFWDRLMAGYVVDFVDVTIPLIDYRWPAFNVADSCVCIAACMFLIASFFGKEEETTDKVVIITVDPKSQI